MARKASRFSTFAAYFTRQPKTLEQFINLLHSAENNHVVSLEAGNAIERLLQASTMQAREIMIPKSQMITVHEEDDLETIISIVKESGHSRFPVLNRTNTEIVGI